MWLEGSLAGLDGGTALGLGTVMYALKELLILPSAFLRPILLEWKTGEHMEQEVTCKAVATTWTHGCGLGGDSLACPAQLWPVRRPRSTPVLRLGIFCRAFAQT